MKFKMYDLKDKIMWNPITVEELLFDNHWELEGIDKCGYMASLPRKDFQFHCNKEDVVILPYICEIINEEVYLYDVVAGIENNKIEFFLEVISVNILKTLEELKPRYTDLILLGNSLLGHITNKYFDKGSYKQFKIMREYRLAILKSEGKNRDV